MDIIDKAINGILGSLFPKFDLPRPSMAFLNDLDDLFDSVQDTIYEVYDEVEGKLCEAVKIDSDWMDGIAEEIDANAFAQFIAENVPTELANLTAGFNLDCDGINCLGNVTRSLDLPNLNTSVVEDAVDLVETTAETIFNISDELTEAFGTMLDSVSCSKYEKVSFEGLSGIAQAVGLTDTETANAILGEVLPEFELCSEFSATNSTLGNVITLFNDTLDGLDFSGSNRRHLATEDQAALYTMTLPLKPLMYCFPPLRYTLYSSPLLKFLSGSSVREKYFFTTGAKKFISKLTGKDVDVDEPYEPYGFSFALVTKEVLAASLKINFAGEWTVSLGVRAQLQFAVTIQTDWFIVVNKLRKTMDDLLEEASFLHGYCTNILNELDSGFALYPICKDYLLMYRVMESHNKIPETKEWPESAWKDPLLSGRKDDIMLWIDDAQDYIEAYKDDLNKMIKQYENVFEVRTDWLKSVKKALKKCWDSAHFFDQLRVAGLPPTPRYPHQNWQGLSGFQFAIGGAIPAIEGGTTSLAVEERDLAFRRDWYWNAPFLDVGNNAFMIPRSSGKGTYTLSIHTGGSTAPLKFNKDGRLPIEGIDDTL